MGRALQGRFKAILIQREIHLLEVCRYVSLNSGRVGMGYGPIWGEVKERSVLVEDGFSKKVDLRGKGTDGFEQIPRTQWYLNRPKLKK